MVLVIHSVCFISILSVAACAGSDSLRLVQILFRHGDRTPTFIYKNDPYTKWKDGLGQLTNIGKQQMYTLGLLLRRNYGDHISQFYSPEKTYVKSSYADRALMSAQLLLAGLFPPVDYQIWNPELLWQPIPVHYVPRTMDSLLAAKKSCPVYDAALNAAYKSDRIERLNEENKDLYQYLSKSTGEDVNNITIAESLYNTLDIEKSHNLTLPEWSGNISFDALRILASESLAIFTDSTLMRRLKGGPLLDELISNMLDKVYNSHLNMILFSGHDITIVNLLRTLAFIEPLLPDYGAYVVFELHYASDNHEVRVLYGKDFSSDAIPLKLSFCKSPCLLADFVNGLKDVIPVDWERECIGNY